MHFRSIILKIIFFIWVISTFNLLTLKAQPHANILKNKIIITKKETSLDGRIGAFIGYRPSGLHKGSLRFTYPYNVYSSKLGGMLFRDSLVFEENIQRDVNWGIALGATLEIGKEEGFWLHFRGEGQFTRNFSGANFDTGIGYELPKFEKFYIQPVLFYSLGWTWFQLGELSRRTAINNQEWYIFVQNKHFYSDVRVNLRTFYMALRPTISAGYSIHPSFMIRIMVGYVLPFHHSLALRFFGKVTEDIYEAVVSDPKTTGSGFIYNGLPTDRTIQSFDGLLINAELLFTLKK
ncbi:MAG: hypothetical protein RML72_10125 [Bacteroidia bacterium]|nr:hypothetical protein [Bacteroidia bacterium]MDW8159214.1 hypothetical protein [Bacteroidia bacterium]